MAVRELMKSHLKFYSPRIRIAEQFDVSATNMLAIADVRQPCTCRRPGGIPYPPVACFGNANERRATGELRFS